MWFRESQYNASVYNTDKFELLVDHVAASVLTLREQIHFDAIAFRGVSGSALAFPVSYLTKIPLICVRKTTEGSHGYPVEGGQVNVREYAILDDFIKTGDTINAIVRDIEHYGIHSNVATRGISKCVALLMYRERIRVEPRTFEVDCGSNFGLYEIPRYGIKPDDTF